VALGTSACSPPLNLTLGEVDETITWSEDGDTGGGGNSNNEMTKKQEQGGRRRIG